MATLLPAITVSATPGLSVTTSVPGMTYNALIAALGSINYDIDTLYYGNQMLAQLANPITYNHYDNVGNQKAQIISTPVDPAQFQPTLYLPLKAKGIIFDGQSSVGFLFLAGNLIQFIFYGSQTNISNALNRNGDIDNFKDVERSMGKPGFFDDDQEEKKPDPVDISFVDDLNQGQGQEMNFSATGDQQRKPMPLQAAPLVPQKIRKQTFVLNLANNTTGNIPVTLMQQGDPQTSIANATTRYAWDVTGISYAFPNVSFSYYTAGGPANYTTVTGVLQSLTAQGVVNLLNTLNVGVFWLEISGPNTYIVTWNNNVVYGNLIVGIPSTVITWANTSVLNPSSMQVLNNAVVVINSAAPPGSGSVNVGSGDVITGSYILGGGLPNANILIQRTLIAFPFTVQTIYTDTGSGFGNPIPPFVIDTNYTYDITLSANL